MTTMTTIRAVYSYTGSMLTPKFVLEQIDTETASTDVSVASPYGEPQGIADDPPSRETNESRPTSALDPKPFVTSGEGGGRSRR
ncbi:MAG: hypothetical protein ACRDTJ_28405 [Pseudonocardiaceae bacterium]